MLKIIFLLLLLHVGMIRSFNHSFTVTDSIEVDEILPCFTNITGRYLKNTNFLFVLEEIEKIESFHLFFENLSGTVTIQNEKKFKGKFGFFVFFPEENKSYRNILQVISPFTYNRWVF